MNIGRSIPEIIRTIQALQVAELSNALAPANWIPCEPVITRPPQTFTGLMQRAEEIKENRNGMNWYLSFEKPKECCKINYDESLKEKNPKKQ